MPRPWLARSWEGVTDLQKDAGSILGLLQKVDASFRRWDDALKKESAINDKGFEVEFIRRENEESDVHPFTFSDHDGDLWPVQARRAVILAQSPLFSQVVISATGKMATMHTVDPGTFVEFKQWMATLESREPMKRRRDTLQANVVRKLLDKKQLSSKL